MEDSCKIIVSAVERSWNSTTRSWHVQLQNPDARRRTKPTLLLDPLSKLEYEGLRWYTEDFALQDPFVKGRANKVTQDLARFARSLSSLIQSHLNELFEAEDSAAYKHPPKLLQLAVLGNGTSDSLHALPWELLERDACHVYASKVSSRISISRLVNPIKTQTSPLVIHGRAGLRILYVSSRPDLERDISYRAISRQIWELLKITRERGLEHIIRFVRPGTWTEFKRKLKDYGKDYFDIVHFDMHGTIKHPHLLTARAQLHFSPEGAGSSDPELKSASAVAKELFKRGVKNVVLNACNAAVAGLSEESNLACHFASEGVSNVVAMPYKVKTDAAAMLMQKFYSSLLIEGRGFVEASAQARAELRRMHFRTGRYGMNVDCEDEYNCVCYCSNLDTGSTFITKMPAETEISNAHVDTSSTGQTGFSQISLQATNSASPTHIERIQDLDLLSLEELLVESPLAFVTGWSGTGKTSLALHLETWWKETSFARVVEYFDIPSNIDNLQGLHKFTDRVTAPTRESANSSLEEGTEKYDYDEVLLLDDVDFWATASDATLEKEGICSMEEYLNHIIKGDNRTRIVLFTRITADKLESQYPDAAVHKISMPTSQEVTALARQLIVARSPSYSLSRLDAEDLEHFVKFHGNNIGFLHTFIPHLAALNVPPKNFIDSMLDHPRACDFAALNEQVLSPDSLHLLQYLHRCLGDWKSMEVLSFRMIYPLCMFQKRIPLDPRLWLYKLYEKGLFSGGKPQFEPYPVESGKIHVLDVEEGWERFPTDWGFERSWEVVRRCLVDAGLLQDGKSTSTSSERYLRAHPILPYFLRHGIAHLGLRDSEKYWSHLRVAQWEYYEVRANSFTLKWLSDPSSRYTLMTEINDDVENLYQAIRFSVDQPCFPFRIMRVYNLISYINFTAMGRAALRRWRRLFDLVLQRFERIRPEEQWTDSQDQEFRQNMIVYALVVARCLGVVLEELDDKGAVIQNTDRALRLKETLSKHVNSANDAIEAVFYTLQVQNAEAIPVEMWSLETLDWLETLMLSPYPAVNERARLAAAQLANHLCHDRDKIPRSHPLRAHIEPAFERGRTFIQGLHNENIFLVRHLSLAGRAAITYTAGEQQAQISDAANFTSKEQVVRTIRAIQRDFEDQPPSNSAAYAADARAFTVDTDVLTRGDGFVFDMRRLKMVLEIAKDVGDVENQVFCLERLERAARFVDADEEAAEGYARVLREARDEMPGNEE